MTATITNELDPPATGLVGALPCHQVNPETFFAEAPAEIEYAKALCSDCPIRTACFEGAIVRREAAGVWGGQLFHNGVVIARKRPRGRPRKHPRAQVSADQVDSRDDRAEHARVPESTLSAHSALSSKSGRSPQAGQSQDAASFGKARPAA